jgi:hypothetical protein
MDTIILKPITTRRLVIHPIITMATDRIVVITRVTLETITITITRTINQVRFAHYTIEFDMAHLMTATITNHKHMEDTVEVGLIIIKTVYKQRKGERDTQRLFFFFTRGNILINNNIHTHLRIYTYF